MRIPVLVNHNSAFIVGMLTLEQGDVVVSFARRFAITTQEVFHIFGGCAFTVLQQEGEGVDAVLLKIKITHWSFDPAKLPPKVPRGPEDPNTCDHQHGKGASWYWCWKCGKDLTPEIPYADAPGRGL
jgi:hypothetical protein